MWEVTYLHAFLLTTIWAHFSTFYKAETVYTHRSLPELHWKLHHLKFNASSHHKPFENHQQIEWHKTYFWQVMSLRPNHPVWQRSRAKHHAGVNCSRKPVYCNYCELKTASEINDSGIFKSNDDTDNINSNSFKGTKEFWAKFIKPTFLLRRFLVLQSCCCYYYWAENQSFLPEKGEEESKENQMLVVNSGKYGCWTIIIIIIIVVLFLWQTYYQRTHSMWDLSSLSSIGKDGILLGCYVASTSRVRKVKSTLLQATKSQRRRRDLALLFP
jgi:hypothetical protein